MVPESSWIGGLQGLGASRAAIVGTPGLGGVAGVLSSSGALAGDAGVLGRQEETPEAAGLWSSGSLDCRVQT